MDGGFDGLDGPKHERVARALEQVNGFRYSTKVLRFGELPTRQPVSHEACSFCLTRVSPGPTRWQEDAEFRFRE
jgi:hypothetical protein